MYFKHLLLWESLKIKIQGGVAYFLILKNILFICLIDWLFVYIHFGILPSYTIPYWCSNLYLEKAVIPEAL